MSNQFLFRLSLLLCAFIMLGGSSALVAAEEKGPAEEKKPWFETWFEPELNPELLTVWKSETLDLGWSKARTYTHHPKQGVASHPKKIVAILPKKAGSYPKAFGRLLAYVADKFPGSAITLCNFYNNEENVPKVLELARSQKADLIFTLGTESATAASKYYVNCGIPVVTCISKDPVLLGLLKDADKGSGNNIAYTTVNMSADALFLWVLKFRPALKRVALLFDRQREDVNIAEVAPLRDLFAKKGIEVIDIDTNGTKTVLTELDAEMPKALQAMQAKDPTFSESIFLITSCNSLWEQPGLGRVVKLAGNCPVLATVTDAVTGDENGALIGIGIDRGSAAHLSAVYAGRILSGKEKPQTMPMGRVTPPDIAISFCKARQIRAAVPFEFFENASFIYDYSGHGALPAEGEQPVEGK